MQNRDISGNATQNPILVSFHSEASQLTWQPLGDRVMGGQSNGTVDLAEGGVGVFHGTVRLDNGGGFSSVKANLATVQGLSWHGFSSTAGHHDNALYDALIGQNR